MTGGVKTPVMPTRETLQAWVSVTIGRNVTTPAFFGLIVFTYAGLISSILLKRNLVDLFDRSLIRSRVESTGVKDSKA